MLLLKLHLKHLVNLVQFLMQWDLEDHRWNPKHLKLPKLPLEGRSK
jgi:hypothetical protein